MSKKKPEYLDHNTPILLGICDENGYEYEKLSKYHYRIMGGTHIIDVWPSRMIYHRVGGESIQAFEDYHRKLDTKINIKQVQELLSTGRFDECKALEENG